MQKLTNRKGFTLVELSIATAFLSILLVTLALIIINIINMYNKGLALKYINSTGRELIDSFTTSIASAPTKDLTSSCIEFYNYNTVAYNKCIADEGYKYVYHQRTANVSIGGAPSVNVPISGAFCTGYYSYVWNTGYLFNKEDYQTSAPAASLKYTYNGVTKTINNFRLLRVADPSRYICASQVNSSYEFTFTSAYDTTQSRYSLSAEPYELLNKDGYNNLAIFDFKAYLPAQNNTSKQIFYPATFTLATISGGINIAAQGDYCIMPQGIDTDFYYCAINKFNFAARAIGEQNNEESNNI